MGRLWSKGEPLKQREVSAKRIEQNVKYMQIQILVSPWLFLLQSPEARNRTKSVLGYHTKLNLVRNPVKLARCTLKLALPKDYGWFVELLIPISLYQIVKAGTRHFTCNHRSAQTVIRTLGKFQSNTRASGFIDDRWSSKPY